MSQIDFLKAPHMSQNLPFWGSQNIKKFEPQGVTHATPTEVYRRYFNSNFQSLNYPLSAEPRGEILEISTLGTKPLKKAFQKPPFLEDFSKKYKEVP